MGSMQGVRVTSNPYVDQKPVEVRQDGKSTLATYKVSMSFGETLAKMAEAIILTVGTLGFIHLDQESSDRIADAFEGKKYVTIQMDTEEFTLTEDAKRLVPALVQKATKQLRSTQQGSIAAVKEEIAANDKAIKVQEGVVAEKKAVVDPLKAKLDEAEAKFTEAKAAADGAQKKYDENLEALEGAEGWDGRNSQRATKALIDLRAAITSTKSALAKAEAAVKAAEKALVTPQKELDAAQEALNELKDKTSVLDRRLNVIAKPAQNQYERATERAYSLIPYTSVDLTGKAFFSAGKFVGVNEFGLQEKMVRVGIESEMGTLERICKLAIAYILILGTLGMYTFNDSLCEFVESAFNGTNVSYVTMREKDLEQQLFLRKVPAEIQTKEKEIAAIDAKLEGKDAKLIEKATGIHHTMMMINIKRTHLAFMTMGLLPGLQHMPMTSNPLIRINSEIATLAAGIQRVKNSVEEEEKKAELEAIIKELIQKATLQNEIAQLNRKAESIRSNRKGVKAAQEEAVNGLLGGRVSLDPAIVARLGLLLPDGGTSVKGPALEPTAPPRAFTRAAFEGALEGRTAPSETLEAPARLQRAPYGAPRREPLVSGGSSRGIDRSVLPVPRELEGATERSLPRRFRGETMMFTPHD